METKDAQQLRHREGRGIEVGLEVLSKSNYLCSGHARHGCGGKARSPSETMGARSGTMEFVFRSRRVNVPTRHAVNNQPRDVD